MKKHILIHTNIIICCVIIVGFLLIAATSYYTYGTMIRQDIENISKLVSSNIYSSINSELTKPIFVSLTMANDTFLKNWLREEKLFIDNDDHESELQEYLLALKEKYGYNSVFLVSSGTDRYYHYKGLHKIISPENAHDVWYYVFLNKGVTYVLDIDVDEADHNTLTVFVNCRITDAEGKLMGVVGVGLKMNRLQEMLSVYEKNFDLKAFLINKDGLVQVHTDKNAITKVNAFNSRPLKDFKNEIINSIQTSEVYWYKAYSNDNCIIVRYIEQLGWYLVVEKDAAVIRNSFISQMARDSAIIAIVLVILLTLSYSLISGYKKMMTKLVTTDELTNLSNRRAFNHILQNEITKRKKGAGNPVAFIFDIDKFKRINDAFGHLFGNYVLTRIGNMAISVLGTDGAVARWGGDEFSGVVYGGAEKAREVLERFRSDVENDEEFKKNGVTVSVGAAAIVPSDSLESLLERADKALYVSKTEGRNRITFV